MKVLSIDIIQGHGPDEIFLNLDIPCGTYPYIGNASARIQVSADYAEEYVSWYLPNIPVNKIVRNPIKSNFSGDK